MDTEYCTNCLACAHNIIQDLYVEIFNEVNDIADKGVTDSSAERMKKNIFLFVKIFSMLDGLNLHFKHVYLSVIHEEIHEDISRAIKKQTRLYKKHFDELYIEEYSHLEKEATDEK